MQMQYIVLALLLVGLLAACATNTGPQITHDGLVRDPSVRYAQVFRKPGASLANFSEYGLQPCRVSFRRNWLRDQNRGSMNLSSRVTQQDVDRIKDVLSAECDRHFRGVLDEPPSYTVVDNFDDGESVLVLRPSIIDLDVAAPDRMSAGRSRTYTTSSGEMTLVLEGNDATTGEILFRVVDRRQSADTGRLQWTNAVTNRSDAERALRLWASRLRQALDRAHEQQRTHAD